MGKIKVFTQNYLDRMFKESQENSTEYLNRIINFYEDNCFAKGVTGIIIDDKLIKDVNSSISVAGSTKEDIDNSIRIYEALNINLTTASDPRLWVSLVHTIFWDYMKMRWPLENLDRQKMASRIKDRYHLRNLSLNNLSRNGISRLWWIAHLTVDDERSDKYELTKILASKQDLIAGLLERYLGSNDKIRKSVLQFFLENTEYIENEDKRRELLRRLNLIGGVKNLPLLKDEEIRNAIEAIV
ncbi:MAG: DUF6339 family protein [Candidatus Scalindua sp.]